MSAAEMREAAAKLCDHELEACKIRIEEARSNSEAHEWEAACDTAEELAHLIRALPLPDEEGMVERVALALYNEYRGRSGMPPVDHIGANRTPACETCRVDARAVLRAINGGEP